MRAHLQRLDKGESDALWACVITALLSEFQRCAETRFSLLIAAKPASIDCFTHAPIKLTFCL